MNGILGMGGNHIESLKDPKKAQGAATKEYVDGHDPASGITYH